jgi:phosphate uptake regulator
MDIRNVQKTGSMYYMYLPTNWCKQYNVKAGSKVSTYQNNDGALAISAELSGKELKHLDLHISKEDQINVNKLIVACYVNPLKSFTITLEKDIDISKLLVQKRLLSVEMVEFDGKHITCESSFSIDDPLSLIRTMIKKIKNLLYIMRTNYNKELIERYEEEIDRSNLHITKSVISIMTHNKHSKYKLIDLHYMSTIAKDMEKLVDHLKEIPRTETKYLISIDRIITDLENIFLLFDSKAKQMSPYDGVMKFLNSMKDFPHEDVKNMTIYHKVRIQAAIESISRALMNWAITEEIYATK